MTFGVAKTGKEYMPLERASQTFSYNFATVYPYSWERFAQRDWWHSRRTICVM
jgi:hypothetical protein